MSRTTIARLFKSGNSMALRLPKGTPLPKGVHAFDVTTDGDAVVLRPHVAAQWPKSLTDALTGPMLDIPRLPARRSHRRVEL